MKRISFAFVVLQFVVASLFAADVPQSCRLCAGAVADLSAPPPSAVVPLLVRVRQDDLATAGTQLDAMSPQQRSHATVIVSYAVDHDKDALLDVEEHTKAIVDWARQRGPFEAFGVAIENADPTIAGYGTKRLAVSAQGLSVAQRIAVDAPSIAELSKLFDGGAASYFDVVVTDAALTSDVAKWLLEHDPAKKIAAVVSPRSPNTFFDVAQAYANGATIAFQAQPADPAALANLNQAFAGEYAYDSTSNITVLNAQGNAARCPC